MQSKILRSELPSTRRPCPPYQQSGWRQEQPASSEVDARLEAQHHVDVSAEPLDACGKEQVALQARTELPTTRVLEIQPGLSGVGSQGGPSPNLYSPTSGNSAPTPRALLTIHSGDSEARGDHHNHEPKAGTVVIQKNKPVHATLEQGI